MRTSKESEKRPALVAFGHLLKRLRTAADLTQEELAERAMVSARSISDLERGTPHRPRRDTVHLLAEGLRLKGSEREEFIALARGRASTVEAETARAPLQAAPHPPTPIVGRLKETAAATAMVLDPAVRLLTLTGPGGVGKTRLALEVAARVADAMPDGVVFVPLAPVRDPELVLSAIAQAVGITATPDVPLFQAVLAALADRQMLLILDNFEQVPDAAAIVAELLATTPALTVLITSRTPLHIRAEREYSVGPLMLPDDADLASLARLSQVPAVELFVHRAEVANRHFALSATNAQHIADITIRLDGLPLAIELAANRMKILSPAALLARMEQRLPLLTRGAHDLPLRQQAMRATLDWSFELLSPEEQNLFCRLSVFAGGCTVDAAEYVSRAVPSPAQTSSSPTPNTHHPSPTFVLDLLADLVDKSLLRTQPDLGDDHRFVMLETIREYGIDKLAEAGREESARLRHQAWCIDLAARADQMLLGSHQHAWHSRLDMEHDNLRVALGWAIANGQADAALQLGGTLYRFWGNHGHYEEGRRWLEQALALDAGTPSAARGHALIGLGVMVFFQGDYAHAASIWEESLALFTALDDKRGIAYSHGNLGLIADARENYPRAAASYEAALRLFRELEDETYIGFMLHNLGLLSYFQGNYVRARMLFEESLSLVQRQQDETSVAMTLGNLGLVSFAEGDFEQALALQCEALANWQKVNNRPWLARAIEHFALIAAATSRFERAARLFAAGAALREQFGGSQPPNDQQINQRSMTMVRERLGEQRYRAAWRLGEAMTLEEGIAYAQDACTSVRRPDN